MKKNYIAYARAYTREDTHGGFKEKTVSASQCVSNGKMAYEYKYLDRHSDRLNWEWDRLNWEWVR